MPGRSDFKFRVPDEWRSEISQAATHLGTSNTMLVLGVTWAIARVLNKNPDLFQEVEKGCYQGGGSLTDMISQMAAEGLLSQAKSKKRRLRRKKAEPD